MYIQMRFEWDEAKDRSNRVKHRVSFETAAKVFLDPFHISRQDRFMEGEERWQTLGLVNGVLILLVAHQVDEEEDMIRIISARRATRRERMQYEEARQV
jgi:uncharacterized DUF497 family protein